MSIILLSRSGGLAGIEKTVLFVQKADSVRAAASRGKAELRSSDCRHLGRRESQIAGHRAWGLDEIPWEWPGFGGSRPASPGKSDRGL